MPLEVYIMCAFDLYNIYGAVSCCAAGTAPLFWPKAHRLHCHKWLLQLLRTASRSVSIFMDTCQMPVGSYTQEKVTRVIFKENLKPFSILVFRINFLHTYVDQIKEENKKIRE